MKKSEQISNALINSNWKEEKSNSRKYRKFSKSDFNFFLFVGKNGALRSGRNSSNSRSLTETKFYNNLLK
jgi:hypothetical protein